MKIPYKPAKPSPPEKRLSTDTVKLEVYESFKLKDTNELLKAALSQFNYGYQNLSIKGEWRWDEIEIEDCDDSTKVFLVWRGGEVCWDNPYYKKALSSYNRRIKRYPEELKAYEEAYKKYSMWKKSQDEKEKERRKVNLAIRGFEKNKRVWEPIL